MCFGNNSQNKLADNIMERVPVHPEPRLHREIRFRRSRESILDSSTPSTEFDFIAPSWMPKDNYILQRVFGNIVVLIIHFYTIGCMSRGKSIILEYSRPTMLSRLCEPSPFTVWTLFCQIFYSALSLVYDLTTIFDRHSTVSKQMREWRYDLFCGIVFPFSASVCISGIYPAFLNEEGPLHSNLMWFAVMAYALWELINIPQESSVRSVSHYKCIGWVAAGHLAAFYCIKFVNLGFCYEAMDLSRRTLLFYCNMVSKVILAIVAYNLSWLIKDTVWDIRKIEKEDIEDLYITHFWGMG